MLLTSPPHPPTRHAHHGPTQTRKETQFPPLLFPGHLPSSLTRNVGSICCSSSLPPLNHLAGQLRLLGLWHLPPPACLPASPHSCHTHGPLFPRALQLPLVSPLHFLIHSAVSVMRDTDLLWTCARSPVAFCSPQSNRSTLGACDECRFLGLTSVQLKGGGLESCIVNNSPSLFFCTRMLGLALVFRFLLYKISNIFKTRKNTVLHRHVSITQPQQR